MSTEYSLAKIGPVEFSAYEQGSVLMGSRIGFSIWYDDEERGAETDALFTDSDIIEIIIKLLAVASYVSDDPESVLHQLTVAIANDQYLRAMKP